MKTAVIGMAGLIGTLSIGGCGFTSPSTSTASSHNGVQQITLWESHSGGPVANAETHIVNAFNTTHPKIHVTINVTKASTKALAALAAGNQPPLAEISHYDGNFRTAHALVSFNPYIHGSTGMTPSQIHAMYPGVWHNGQVGGQHYRMQVDAKVSEFFYNKSLFRQAGIQSPPTTWTQLSHDLAKLKKIPGIIPMAFKDSSAHILAAFLANGGHFYQPGSHQHRADFNSAAAQQTFSFFHGLYQSKEMIFAHGTSIRADLSSGKLAIADATSAGYMKAKQSVGSRFQLGAFAYPKGSSGHAANIIQGLGFVMMIHHSNASYNAAWQFVKFFLSGKQQAYWARQTGFAPETRSALKYFTPSYIHSNAGLKVSIAELNSPYSVSRPQPDSYSEVQATLDSEFFQAVEGKISVSQALASLQQQSNRYLSGSSVL